MAFGVVEGGEAFDELLQLHGRHDDADALGFLHDEVFENEVLDELLLELHRLEAGRIEIGILGAHLLLKLFVFPLELLNGDGFPVHGEDDRGRAARQAADAPEDEDQNDDAKGDFDAPRLGVGSNEIQHDSSSSKVTGPGKPYGAPHGFPGSGLHFFFYGVQQAARTG